MAKAIILCALIHTLTLLTFSKYIAKFSYICFVVSNICFTFAIRNSKQEECMLQDLLNNMYWWRRLQL